MSPKWCMKGRLQISHSLTLKDHFATWPWFLCVAPNLKRESFDGGIWLRLKYEYFCKLLLFDILVEVKTLDGFAAVLSLNNPSLPHFCR
jgi:hypothetical protein